MVTRFCLTVRFVFSVTPIFEVLTTTTAKRAKCIRFVDISADGRQQIVVLRLEEVRSAMIPRRRFTASETTAWERWACPLLSMMPTSRPTSLYTPPAVSSPTSPPAIITLSQSLLPGKSGRGEETTSASLDAVLLLQGCSFSSVISRGQILDRLNLGSDGDRWHEPKIVEGLEHVKVRYASASGVVSAAVGEDGSLWVWGRSKRGQLGLGNGITEAIYPIKVNALEGKEIVKVLIRR